MTEPVIVPRLIIQSWNNVANEIMPYDQMYQDTAILNYIDNQTTYDGTLSFKFDSQQTLIFDLKNTNYEVFFDLIKKYPKRQLFFFTVYNNTNGCGQGVNRQVYYQIANDLINRLFIIDGHFMDIDINNSFWQVDDNIRLFVIFIALFINAKCVLPYHFHPILLEKISYKAMTFTELEFFMSKIDDTIVNSIKKVSPTDFKSLDLDYDTAEDYYRSKIFNKSDPNKIKIYDRIAQIFDTMEYFFIFNILTIDKAFSGSYIITHLDIINMTHIDKEKYQSVWENFIRSLNESELKQMLITFGNSLSLQQSFYIKIDTLIKRDIQISTCARVITINQVLFDNPDQLQNLKLYFKDNDQIYDSVGDDNYPDLPELLDINFDDVPPLVEDETPSSQAQCSDHICLSSSQRQGYGHMFMDTDILRANPNIVYGDTDSLFIDCRPESNRGQANRANPHIIYGDTDSLFISCQPESNIVQQTRAIFRYNDDNTTRIGFKYLLHFLADRLVEGMNTNNYSQSIAGLSYLHLMYRRISNEHQAVGRITRSNRNTINFMHEDLHINNTRLSFENIQHLISFRDLYCNVTSPEVNQCSIAGNMVPTTVTKKNKRKQYSNNNLRRRNKNNYKQPTNISSYKTSHR